MTFQGSHTQGFLQVPHGQHETAECSKPDMSLRDLLCARSDTSILCRWLDDDHDAHDDDAENGSGSSSNSSFWSLAAGLTFFVVADAALLSTQGLPSGLVPIRVSVSPDPPSAVTQGLQAHFCFGLSVVRLLIAACQLQNHPRVPFLSHHWAKHTA